MAAWLREAGNAGAPRPWRLGHLGRTDEGERGGELERRHGSGRRGTPALHNHGGSASREEQTREREEKLDSMSRNGIRGGRLGFFSDIALVLIDEVHLLNDPRGAALEAVVSRIKMLSRPGNMKSPPLANVRFIAVSATNAEDIAEWLLAPPEGIKRFGEEMRPVKLTTKVLGMIHASRYFSISMSI
ncbi:putative ATP-dependent DNA helicase HFM1 [Hordeum vulgare]|nr:putative ATP-dependent DNA helicase HFM1 [Hordeum vulgare]